MAHRILHLQDFDTSETGDGNRHLDTDQPIDDRSLSLGRGICQTLEYQSMTSSTSPILLAPRGTAQRLVRTALFNLVARRAIRE